MRARKARIIPTTDVFEKGAKEMFQNYYVIQNRMKEIERIRESLQNEDRKYPEGELICARNGKWYKWYLCHQGQSLYLPKDKRGLAVKLARKKYNEAMQKDLNSEHASCAAYIKQANRSQKCVEEFLLNEGYRSLLGDSLDLIVENGEEWMNDIYETNEMHPENLVVKGITGKMLRSKSEAMIEQALFYANIPYRYECKLELDNKILYPDFTMLHPETKEKYYWEHMGMMDNPEYVQHACKKVEIYCSAGIYPGQNLILTYETKDNPLGMGQITRVLEEKFGM